ncbi:hypothetical protein PCL1606_45990 [Pseudomonas chlororaphis]|uniref:Uncharacterized protein n=1 Tax=Pseudomonas chlororaphis TaxID=587753 RepID=A0A0D5Y4W9_9PSED|nr:hypothetical protein PCL1606_45990 [Pseudomonas chlororaphis]
MGQAQGSTGTSHGAYLFSYCCGGAPSQAPLSCTIEGPAITV